MTESEVIEAFVGRTLQAYVITEVLERRYAGDSEAGVEYLRGYLDESLLTKDRNALRYVGKPTRFYDPEGTGYFVGEEEVDGTYVIPWGCEEGVSEGVGQYAYRLLTGNTVRGEA